MAEEGWSKFQAFFSPFLGMCGIAGILGQNPQGTERALQAMVASLHHRGPDSSGFYTTPHVALGHRRLAVLDLSKSANQPMHDGSGRYSIVYNGEIFNFRELRSLLEKMGCLFRTTSDTEVVLEAFKAWDVECLRHFNGMFALAIWDQQLRRLVLARDRLGEKPLYYALLPGNGLIFASESRALVASGMISKTIDREAVQQFFALGYILGSHSIFRSVKKLPPASCLVMTHDASPVISSYWDLSSFFRKKDSSTQWPQAEEDLRQHLQRATVSRMVSDVPLGSFLSGGVDSSIITEIMSAETAHPSSAHAFSLGFSERTFCELPEARRVAEFLGVTHHMETASPPNLQDLRTIAGFADEPFADSSMIPTFYLSRFARKTVTVALAGDGADELFGGYETYLADLFHPWLKCVSGPLTNSLLYLMKNTFPAGHGKISSDYKLRKFLESAALSSKQAHCFWRTLSDDHSRHLLLAPSRGATPFQEFLDLCFKTYLMEADGMHPLDQAMYLDLKTWLPDDILVKSDRMSMASSLEVRSPFLDHSLVEFSAGLPVEMKINRFRTKFLLKRAYQARLPHSVMAGKKRGFNAPVSHWIPPILQSYLEDTKPTNNAAFDWIDHRFISTLLKEHQCRRHNHGYFLYAILIFILWMEKISE